MILSGAGIDFNTIIGATAPNLADKSVTEVIGIVVGYIFPLVGLLIILYFIYGGYTYMTSRGNPQQMAQAQGIIVNALIGFIVVFTSYWVVQFAGYIFGISAITDLFGSL